MRTNIDINAMQMASFLSSSEHFKNPHPARSWDWHWHERMIREAAGHMANMKQMNHPLIQQAKIFGTLEALEHRLAKRTRRASRPHQKV
ncbi:MAG: hypothetical protein Q7R72_01455 [bacterium]|nr:hypothetical protein [bacterium]